MPLSWHNSARDSPCTWFESLFSKISHNLLTGAVHEITRFDRDNYVKVLTDNIIPSYSQNFDRKNESYLTTSNTSFDISSIMMFGPTNWGKLDDAGGRMTTVQSLVPGVEIK